MISAGDLLVAPPQMKDPRFSETVILVVHSGPDGHWGLCLNKGLGISVSQLMQQAGMAVDLNTEIYWGGPVNQGVIWLLHDRSWGIPATLDITSDWFMTSHKHMFQHLNNDTLPKNWRMFSGFSAWAPGQLEAELQGDYPWSASSSWLVCSGFNPEWAFDQPEDDLWKNAISHSGRQTVNSWF